MVLNAVTSGSRNLIVYCALIFFLLKKNLMHTFIVVILHLNLNVDIVKSNTRVPMAVPSMRSRMLVIILNVNFVIKVFSFQRV